MQKICEVVSLRNLAGSSDADVDNDFYRQGYLRLLALMGTKTKTSLE